MLLQKAFLCVGIVSAALWAQEAPEKPVSQSSIAVPSAHQTSSYLLGEGDLLEIRVFGVEELSSLVRIGSRGSISLPLLGHVDAAGLTKEDLEQALAAKLSDLRLVRDPQVTVFLKEYRSQAIHVLGAVNKPGQYVITSSMRLIDAISLAGGLDPLRSGSTVLVKHQSTGESGLAPTLAQEPGDPNSVETVDLKALMERVDPELNILLRSGDVVQVLERKSEVFYVVGDVNRAGVFEYPSQGKRDLLVSQALAMAGGPARTAKTKAGLLVRYGPDGERQQLAVDLGAILKGKRKDFPVRPNDIIFIPGSTFKSLAAAFTQAAPWAVSNSLVYGLVAP